MDYAKTLSLGNRIEVRVSQQTEQAKQDGQTVPCYLSNVFEVLENEELEIFMPTDHGKLILFPVGVRLDLVIFTKGGMIGCQCRVIDRYKKENFFLLKLKLLGDLERVQRREFYRMKTTLDFSFYELTEEQSQIVGEKEMLSALEADEEFYLQERVGLAVDISGGGMRFRGNKKLIEGSTILTYIPLTVSGVNKEYHVVAYVIASYALPQDPDIFESRVKFKFFDDKTQECIIRYIFEEERRLRKKENG